MNISDNTDNIDRSVCPICKQKVISIANIPACSQCRRLLYHSNTAEIQNRFYEASGNMKNLADNMDSNCSHDEIAQSLFDFFEAVENVKKCMNV